MHKFNHGTPKRSQLRRNSDGDIGHSVKIKSAVGKPIRVFPSETEEHILLLPDDVGHGKSIHIVTNEDVADELYSLGMDVKPCNLYVWVSSSGEYGADVVSFSEDSWTASRYEGMQNAFDHWTIIRASRQDNAYTHRILPGTKEPEWFGSIDEMLENLFKERIIDAMDHPVITHYLSKDIE